MPDTHSSLPNRHVGGRQRHLIRLFDAIERYKLIRATFDQAANAGFIRKYKLARAVYLDVNEIEAWITGEAHRAE